MLSASDITKTYGQQIVLRSVTLTIAPGTITVLLGPSGSGKTTLLQALALLDPPDGGMITINATTLNFPRPGVPPNFRPWPGVTVVFQQLFLWPHLTLRENVLLALPRRSRPSPRVTHVFELFEMNRFLDRYPNQVSIGERQRAALARAVVLDPQYILLDEITSALDVKQTQAILHYLLTLRSRGIGILVITHHIQFALRLLARGEGDQVAFLENGRLLECGALETLTSPSMPRFREFLAAMEGPNE
jgi:cystine transport system ATP-binding protein